MSQGNGSSVTVTEFFLVGFPGLHPEYFGLVSFLLFLVYSLTLLGNGMTFILFVSHRVLQKPMYYVMLNLSVCDVLFSTTTLPKIISKYWFHLDTISFDGCFVQMFFVHYLGSVNSFILFLMALDRYLAICHPLRYPQVFKPSTVLILSVTAWTLATLGALTMAVRAYPLPYCASNVINHCYCDHIGITVLACTDRTPYSLPAFSAAMIVLLGPLAFIIFSYISIVTDVLKIADLQGRLKTLSTCSAQLTIICLYYLPRCFVYLAGVAGIKFSPDLRIVLIMLYSLVPPMVNPLIYYLRAKDVKESFRRLLIRKSFRISKKKISAVGN